VLPFPVELLRFLERSTPPAVDDSADATTPAAPVPAGVPLPRSNAQAVGPA
jgi:hypothetical protein